MRLQRFGILVRGLAAIACATASWSQSITTGATFGDTVELGGTPADIVVDELRGRLYLVNSNANRIDLYDYRLKKVTGSIPVGSFPIGAAMSPDGARLYVTNTQASSLAVIELGADRVTEFISLPAKPEGVAVGNDGRVLITTQGTGTNNTTNTLLLYDPRQGAGQQIYVVPSPPTLSTPNPLPAVFVGRPATAFPGRLLTTPDGNFIIGMVAINQTTNGASTTLFVYEVASGTVLRNRIVTGQSTVLSISPDGARFMAGSTQYDSATLSVNSQLNVANMPFFLNSTSSTAINLQFNYGGSAFSPNGATLYSAFNNAANGARATSSTLFVSNPRHLYTPLGIRLPESVLGRMVITSDGSQLFALSESGLLDLPVAALYDYPIIQPDSTTVFMAVDDCNRGLARTSIRIGNAGKGKLTYAVGNPGNALTAEVSSGVAPSSIKFTMEPGRTNVVRQAGTNLYTGGANNQGTPVNIFLSSPEAINLPPVIRLFMNYRQSDQRGLVFPIPTSLQNNGLVTGEGIFDMLIDEPRGRLYLTNSGLNRIEVFDRKKLKWLDPIEVGQLPHQMAMSLDGSQLYVGNTGGESIQVVDLETLRVTGNVEFPPIPRNGQQGTLRPVAMAMGLSGLQFVMAASMNQGAAGSFWKLVGNTAVPRTTVNNFPPASTTGPHFMAATPGGEQIIALTTNTNGTAYLYDALADSFVNTRQVWNQAPQSYYAPLAAAPSSNYFLAGGMILSSALSPVGGAERPSTTTTTPGQPGQPPQQNTVSAGLRNVAAAVALNENTFIRMTTPVRQNITVATRDEARTTLERVDVRTQSEQVAAIIPENPANNVFGANRSNIPARQLLVDSAGTAYVVTLSGLVVTPLTQTNSSTQPRIPLAARGVVNSVDGTQTFRPGSFITVSGANLAAASTADTLPLPTVLGGSCIVLNDVALPLLQTAPGQISAQIPTDVRPGLNVLQVRSLANAQQSEPIVVTVQRP